MLTRSPVPARATSASPSSFHATRSHNHNHPHHAFHYASSASSRIRSPKPSAAVSRRQSSSSSAASPLGLNNNNSSSSSSSSSSNSSSNNNRSSQPQPQAQSQAPPPSSTPQAHSDRPAAYVAVDAATQYSPMEPHDYFTTPNVPAKVEPLTGVQSLSAHASTKTTALSQPQPAAAAAAAAASSSRPAAYTTYTSQASTDGAVSLQEATAATPGPSDGPPMLKAPHPLSPTKRRNSDAPGLLVGGRPSGEGSGAAAGAVPKRVKPEVAPPKVLPVQYELCAYEDIVVLIAHMLAELIETNDALALTSGHLTRFHSRTAPGISVLDYLLRLAKHATLSPPLLLSMVYYIDRLCALYPDFTINTLTVHRFLITAATVAAKGLSDSFWNNSTYARVGGVRVAELKLLELEFLHKVDWKIVPDPDVLVAYYRGLVQRCPAYQLEDEVDEEACEDTAVADESDGTEVSNDPDEGDEQEEEEGEASAGAASRTATSAQEKPPDAPPRA